jgi:hypothetical protein
VECRTRRPRVPEARLADGGCGLRRLQLRVDVDGGLHHRLLCRRRSGDEACVPAAQHDGLLVVRAADAD